MGVTRDTLDDMLRFIKREHPEFSLTPTRAAPATIELDPTSVRMRARLGQILWSYRDNGGETIDRSTVAMTTGVPPRGQARAEATPYDHDWTFDQLSRLAGANNLTFEDLMKRVVY